MCDRQAPAVDLLQGFQLFQGLDERQLRAVAAIASIEQVPEGSVLLQEGEPADAVRVIQNGRVTVSISVPGQPDVVVSTLSRGQLLGFSALFDDRRWTASGRALKACTLVVIPGPELIELGERDHAIGYHLMRNALESVANQLRDARLQLLDIFGERAESSE